LQICLDFINLPHWNAITFLHYPSPWVSLIIFFYGIFLELSTQIACFDGLIWLICNVRKQKQIIISIIENNKRERGRRWREEKNIVKKKQKRKKERKRERENPLNDHFNLIQTLIGKL